VRSQVAAGESPGRGSAHRLRASGTPLEIARASPRQSGVGPCAVNPRVRQSSPTRVRLRFWPTRLRCPGFTGGPAMPGPRSSSRTLFGRSPGSTSAAEADPRRSGTSASAPTRRPRSDRTRGSGQIRSTSPSRPCPSSADTLARHSEIFHRRCSGVQRLWNWWKMWKTREREASRRAAPRVRPPEETAHGERRAPGRRGGPGGELCGILATRCRSGSSRSRVVSESPRSRPIPPTRDGRERWIPRPDGDRSPETAS